MFGSFLWWLDAYSDVGSRQEYRSKDGDILHGVAIFECSDAEGFGLVRYIDRSFRQCRHLNILLHGGSCNLNVGLAVLLRHKIPDLHSIIKSEHGTKVKNSLDPGISYQASKRLDPTR